MSYAYAFWGIFLLLLLLMAWCDLKFHLLRDTTASYKPYSWSRVQMAWWLLIILTSFGSIMLYTGSIPTFNESTLILLGISAATSTTARVIDLSEKREPVQGRPSFLLDILSDDRSITVQRLQAVLFHASFGLYFMHHVITRFNPKAIDAAMPHFASNNLVLLGLSSATYAALKLTEQGHSSKAVAEKEHSERKVPTATNFYQ